MTFSDLFLCLVLGRFAKNRKKASPILLIPRERLESIWTRFPVQRFAITAKKTRTETKVERSNSKNFQKRQKKLAFPLPAVLLLY
jgi:hypothetical protein